ncbi:MAG: hypothetical protein ABIN36_01220 [Ferruginibacter sp.]
MRKGITDGQADSVRLSIHALQMLEGKGFKFVQVIGLTLDNHYDYVEPHSLVLLPIKELPTDQSKKDIYEPIGSELLKQWANEVDNGTQVFISTGLKKYR